jgi:hypothetical protein
LDNQDDYRRQENQVNEIPDGIDVDESQQSQNQKHNKDSPEHMFSFELVYFASHPGARVRLKIFGISILFPGKRRYGGLKKLLAARIWNDYNASVGITNQSYAFQIPRCLLSRS